jgi:hypothetical protein
MRSRRGSGSPRRVYELFNEELLQYEGMNGMRCVCHLLVYGCGADPLVCIVGNFDGRIGSPTTNAIEVVATAIAARISRDAFRLLEWYPHDSARRFSEVTLTAVAPERIRRGEVIVDGGTDAHIVRRGTATIQFADPRWRRLSEDEAAELLGEDAVRELRSFAGLPGDYIPERLFGATGKELADAIRAHNREVGDGLEAQIKEWTDS